MNNLGWVKIGRDLQDHWTWSGCKFSDGQAFVDLHLRANHQHGRKVNIRGALISLQRGQLICSENDLAIAWGWSRGKVRRFLSLLEKDGSIVQQKNNRATVVSICEYGERYSLNQSCSSDDQYNELDTNKNSREDSKQDSTVPKTRQQVDGSRYKLKPFANRQESESSQSLFSKIGTADSTGINKKEKKKEKEKAVKNLGKGQMVVGAFDAYLSDIPSGFSHRSWEILIEYLREKNILEFDRLKRIVDEIKKATEFTNSDICVKCIRLHGWKNFKVSWLETSSYYQQKLRENFVPQANQLFDCKPLNDGPESRQWLLDESHFLVLEKKITAEQRRDIITGKLDITPFLDKSVALCG